ncbi:uncharacterized protein LOC101861358 [Aplysia californica]|uniref:Uncharacterized protein LOC101861358 n=1 Tax=Aplysia californica TaxID=6500 RepID=A0ABM0JLU9_APLCA|nr:uncharacterized protein LOC101861358 [Aplysia californica]
MALVIDRPPLRGYSSYQSNTFTMDDEAKIGEKTQDEKHDSSSGGFPGSEARPMSALARGVQITEFAESRVNPTPLLLEESDILLEQYLSPGKLQLLTGVDNLELVESLELKVDSRETSLGNFGGLLPNLTELKLSGSSIACARDLGSSLRKLRVLWLTRCGLEELDGISSMLNLKELYLEYNEVTDISPISMLEHLEILDLEGNNVDDITQVQYLSLCPRLRRLALDGNPICVCPSPTHDEPGYDYRQTIKKLLPNLLVLDDERLDEASSSLIKHNVFDEDWAYLEELQKDAFLQQEFSENQEVSNEAQAIGERPPSAALRPATSYRPGSALRPSSGFRPLSASRRPQTMSGPSTPTRPGTSASVRPVSSDAVEGIESSSELTIGGVICGNPSKALRQRRKGGAGSKEEIQKGLSKLMQKGAIFNHSENAEDVPLKAEDEMNSIIEELQSWKVEHEKRMQDILKTKEAQVLVVDHDEAVEVSDSEEDSDFDLPRETIDYRPGSSQQRHSADLRLKSSKKKMDSVGYPSGSAESSLRAQGVSSRLSASKIRDGDSEYRQRFHSDDYDEDESNPAAEVFHDQGSSLASFSGYARSRSREGSMGDSWSEGEGMTPERPRSRGQGEGGLAPLRAPSPTSAQIINSLRARQTERPPSPRSKRLRVGPTGLPVSSQTPVIRNSIVPPPSRSGLVSTTAMSSVSRGNVPLLPSQPRIARQLPETPKLLPHPPKNS